MRAPADQGRYGQGIVGRWVEGAGGWIVAKEARGGEIRVHCARGRQAIKGVCDTVQDGFKVVCHPCDA